jgi:folylpolyglutamate synthase/dihydropteroate synthase
LANLAHQFGRSAQAILPIEDALAAALEDAGQESVILVTGSIFVAAAAREIYGKMLQNHPQ